MAAPTKAQLQTTIRHATVTDFPATWTGENLALGAEDNQFANTTNNSTEEYLYALDFAPFNLPAFAIIRAVKVDARIRYKLAGDNYQVTVKFRGPGITGAAGTTNTFDQSGTDFRWAFGAGWIIGTPGQFNAANIENLEVGVRRFGNTQSINRRLNCDAFRIIVEWEPDDDDDGIPNVDDACPTSADHRDTRPANGTLDACEDTDGDGVSNYDDECYLNPDLILASDSVCDDCDLVLNTDFDGDGVPFCIDVCPGGDDNADWDNDGIPDACDDSDGDGVFDDQDSCPSNPDLTSPGPCNDPCESTDIDNDGIIDCIDPCIDGGVNPCMDCNGNQVNDTTDIQGGFSADCNLDGIPDECQDPLTVMLRYLWVGPDNGSWSQPANWCAADQMNTGLSPDALSLAELAGQGQSLNINVPSTTSVGAIRLDAIDVNLVLADSLFTSSLVPAIPAIEIGVVDGAASLTLSSGSLIVDGVGSVKVGSGPLSSGTLSISGPSTLLDVGGDLQVGQSGTGLLTVRDGPTVFTNNLLIGDSLGSGLVILESSSAIDTSEVVILRDVVVSNGELQVNDGGRLTIIVDELFLDENGILSGDGGEIDGTVLSVGSIKPGGDGIGHLSVTDNLLLVPINSFKNGTVSIDVGIQDEVIATDSISVGGVTRLGGGLIIDSPDVSAISLDMSETILTTQALDPAFAAFDVVFAPLFDISGAGQQGSLATLIPILSTEGPSVTITLDGISLEELLFGQSDFSPEGVPNDAVIGDANNDGILDLAVAVPTTTNNPNGLIAVFRGTNTSGFTFEDVNLVDLYFNPTEVSAPTSVEIGDFNNDGVNEVAFASGNPSGAPALNDVHVIEYVGNVLSDAFSFPAFDVGNGSVIVDLAVDDGFFASPGSDLAILEHTTAPGSEVNMVRLNIGSNDWDFCVLPVDGDDPDSVDPIDTDGTASSLYTPGIAVTTRSDNRLWVFTPQSTDLTPDDWARLDFPTGVGPRDVRAADLDGDMIDDLVVINQTAGSLTVLRTRGGGDIAPPVDIPASVDPVSLALVDLDDDGDRDIAIVANNETQRVVRQLRNTSTSPGSITLAGAEDIPNQSNGTPVLILSSDLDNSNPSGIEDDLVILVQPGGARGPEGPPMNGVRLSKKCLADVNGDGIVSPADFTAWIAAFNASAPECDQNGDELCTPADFTSWIVNFNAGCD